MLKEFTKSKLKKVAQYMVQNSLVDENDLEYQFMSNVQKTSKKIGMPLHFCTIADNRSLILREMKKEFKKLPNSNPELKSDLSEIQLTFSDGQIKKYKLTEIFDESPVDYDLPSLIDEPDHDDDFDDDANVEGNGLFHYYPSGKILISERSKKFCGIEITDLESVKKGWHTLERAINWCDYQMDPHRFHAVPDRGFKSKDFQTLQRFKSNLKRYTNLKNLKIIGQNE